MGIITVSREGYLNNDDLQMNCSMADMLRAAITVGKSCNDAMSISCIERLFRASAMLMTVNEYGAQQSSYFIASPTFNRLDPSEKGAMTYFLGMAVTKLIAERYFNVPWLMHLDVYRNSYDIESDKGGKPDFIGIANTHHSQGRWHIFESKGRTGGFDRPAIIRGKEQTLYLRTINNVKPSSRNAVQAYFYGKDQVLSGYLIDPVDNNEGVDIKLGLKDLFELYYKPFYDLMELLRHEIDPKKENFISQIHSQYEITYIKPLNIYLGISKIIRRLLSDFDEENFFEMMKQNEEKLSTINSYLIDNEKKQFFSIGRDGIFVSLKIE